MPDKMDIPATALPLIEWIRSQVAGAGAKGVVYGLSGGLDSALVGALCHKAFPESSLAVIMPCHSLDQDMDDARLVADALGLQTRVVVLDHVYDVLRELLDPGGAGLSGEKMQLTLANMKPRLRMIVLYYYASIYNYLVVGGSNKSEITVGYFTKHVDLTSPGNRCSQSWVSIWITTPTTSCYINLLTEPGKNPAAFFIYSGFTVFDI
jgi:NAD+ synthase